MPTRRVRFSVGKLARLGYSGRGAKSRAKGVAEIELLVKSRVEGLWAVIDVEGEVDVFTAPKLRERIIKLTEEGRHKIAVNLEGVAFLDSTGLGTLVGGLKRVREHDGTLALVCTNRRVLRVLSITGLDKVFPIHETVAAATASG